MGCYLGYRSDGYNPVSHLAPCQSHGLEICSGNAYDLVDRLEHFVTRKPVLGYLYILGILHVVLNHGRLGCTLVDLAAPNLGYA